MSKLSYQPFCQRLKALCNKNGISKPAQLAQVLYENDECFNLVHPKVRNEKHVEFRKKDIAAIARTAQKHFYEVEDATDVNSSYLFAYSILFNCSMDYLYGLVDVECPNVEILDISQKTGLSVLAVQRLMNKELENCDEHLSDVYRLDLFNGPDCEYYDTEYLYSDFWDKVLCDDLFYSAPQQWYRMTCALYSHKAFTLIAKDAHDSWNQIPSWESFKSSIETWNAFHERPAGFTGFEMTKEYYESNPQEVLQLFREVRHEYYYESEEKADLYEDIHLGCAGKFDRELLDFFHREAENWCSNGPLYPLK